MKSTLMILAPTLLPTLLMAQSAGPVLITPAAELTATDTARFGGALSLSGDDLLAGSSSAPPSTPARQLVFHRQAGTWSQQAAFSIAENLALECTGRSSSLSIAGDLLAIGRPFNGSLGKGWISRRSGSG